MNMKLPIKDRKLGDGFTLLELLIVIAIVGVILGMLMPAMRTSRGAARRTACSNNLRQLSLAALNYESANGHYPAAMGAPAITGVSTAPDANRYSGLVEILPYLNTSSVYHEISNPSSHSGVIYPAFPSPVDTSYPHWKEHNDHFLCPAVPIDDGGFGEICYAFCIGDAAKNIHSPTAARGASAAGINVTLSEISDGTSNAIYMAEIVAMDSRRVDSQFAINQPATMLDQPELALGLRDTKEPTKYKPSTKLSATHRGYLWSDGSAGSSMFNTILPPQSPSISVGSDGLADGLYSAGSFHNGGVNVVRCDGSTSFVRNDIDCGDLNQPVVDLANDNDTPQPSPYGVWGAAGTIDGAEEATDF